MKITIVAQKLQSACMTKAIAKEYYQMISSEIDAQIVTCLKEIPDFYTDLYSKVLDIKTLKTPFDGGYLDINANPVVEHTSFKGFLKTIFLMIKMYLQLSRDGHDKILFHEAGSAILSIFYLWRKRSRYYLYLHDSPFIAVDEFNNAPNIFFKIAKYLLRYVINNAETTFCVSKQLQETLKDSLGLENILYVPLGIDVAKHNPKPYKRKIVLTYAFWANWRHPERYLPLISKLPDDLKFVFAGHWNSLEDLNAFKSKIIKSGLENKIELKEDISEIEKEALLSETLAFVRYGFNEKGLPGGILEAMGYGCPILINDGLKGISLIKENETGFITNEADEAIDFILRLKTDTFFFKYISENCYKVAKNMSWETHNKKLIENFHSIKNGPL